MKNGGWLVVAGLLGAALAAPAAAQDKGLYFGGSFGMSQYDEACEGAATTCDDTDTAWRVFAGYQFNRYAAIEGGWANMGKQVFEGIVPGVGAARLESEVDGFDIVAVLSVPVLERMSLFGKVGGYRMRVASEVLVAGGATTQAGGKTSGGITWGLGAEYRIGGLGFRAEFQRYDNVGHPEFAEDSVIFYSAGILWRF